jgi:hypothetical protein
MNALRDARSAGAGRLFLDHVDQVCRDLGEPGWFGEMNARAGRRARVIERHVGEVVGRTPNRTLSWLAGSTVDRLTVVRRLPDVRPPAFQGSPSRHLVASPWPL